MYSYRVSLCWCITGFYPAAGTILRTTILHANIVKDTGRIRRSSFAQSTTWWRWRRRREEWPHEYAYISADDQNPGRYVPRSPIGLRSARRWKRLQGRWSGDGVEGNGWCINTKGCVREGRQWQRDPGVSFLVYTASAAARPWSPGGVSVEGRVAVATAVERAIICLN